MMNLFFGMSQQGAQGGGGLEEVEYTFTTNDSIVIPAGYSKLQYLVVGGGGGPQYNSLGSLSLNQAIGAGGGGSVLEGEINNPAAGTYNFSIGAGAWTPDANEDDNSIGNASILTLPDSSTIVANGGGRSAKTAGNPALGQANNVGGSGGGGSSVANFTNGASAGAQGYAGGNGVAGSAAGGGGGSAGAGTTATSTSETPNGGGAGTTSIYFGGTYGAGGNTWAVHSTTYRGTGGPVTPYNDGNGGDGFFRGSTLAAITRLGQASNGVIKVRFIP